MPFSPSRRRIQSRKKRPLVQPAMADQLERPPGNARAAVRELREVHVLQDERLELLAAVARGDRRRGDRARRRAGDALRAPSVLVELAVGTAQPDSLDATALEHEV